MTILDAYAVVAHLRDERAADAVEAILVRDHCLMTALGLAEVTDRMVRLSGAVERELTSELAALGLTEPVGVDASMALAAGSLRARHYSARRRSVSMADFVGAAAARVFDEPLATCDPHLLDMCHEEQIPAIALPGPDGSVWAPA
ncbi:MAG: PIN domain-containing protein [Jatrophihabitantaceae bacterium]